MVNGEALVTESGQSGLFEVLVMFLHHCRASGGNIGGRSLEYLDLGEVARPSRLSLVIGARKLKKLLWL